MLSNILLLHFQITKICNTIVFYMHIVMKCIMTLDVSHNTQMNWPQQMPSLLGPLVAGENYYNKKEKVPVTSSHYDVIT